MLLLVGLGNPGRQYARNRHNIGFMAVDAIVRRHSFGPFRRRFHGLAADGTVRGRKVLALEPLTFMNRSGLSVGAAVRFHKMKPENVLVFYDEIDLAPGKVRVRQGGGHAGHNGIRSLIEHMGPDFRRVRIGVGHPGEKSRVQNYVLHDFARADRDWLDPLLDAIADEVPRLVEGDDSGFMSRVAEAVRPRLPAGPTGSAAAGE